MKGLPLSRLSAARLAQIISHKNVADDSSGVIQSYWSLLPRQDLSTETMGWLTDLFTDVPLSTELREKLAAVEAENDGLKTDNVILKDDLRQAKAHILKLERQVDQYSHDTTLDETDIRILKEVAVTSEPAASYLSKKLEIDIGALDFRLEQLTETDYLSAWSIGGIERYSLRPKGREYLIKNNLVS